MTRPIKHGKKYRIRWHDESGFRQSETHASKSDAQLALRRHLVEVAEVKRCLKALRPPDRTFGELCDYWITHRVPHKKSGQDDVYIIERYLRPALGSVMVRDFGREHVDGYTRAFPAHLKPRTRANHLALVSALLTVAVDLKWITTRPRIRKPKVRLHDQEFRYLKSPAEINRLLKAARETEGQAIFMLYAAAIYTGMRAGELAGLRWSDVDLDRGIITVQRSYATTTKANDIRRVPVQDALMPLLHTWRLRRTTDFVFPNERGDMLRKGARAFEETLHRVLTVARFPMTSQGQRYITFHCLRHTFASHWVMNGGDLYRLQNVLGHKTVQMTARYAHLDPNAFESERGRIGAVAACDSTFESIVPATNCSFTVIHPAA